MGAQVSKNNYEQFNEAVNSVSTNFMSNLVQSTDQNAVINQTIKINADVMNCALDIQQTGKLTLTTISQITSDQVKELNNELVQNVEAEVKKLMEQSQKGIAFGQVQVNEDTTKITNIVRNYVDSNMETNLNNMISVYGEGNQFIDLNVGTVNPPPGSGGVCKFDQDFTIDMIAQSVTDSIIKELTDSKEAQEIFIEYESETKQDVEGLSIEGLINALTSPITMAIIAIIIVFVLILGGIVAVPLLLAGGGGNKK